MGRVSSTSQIVQFTSDGAVAAATLGCVCAPAQSLIRVRLCDRMDCSPPSSSVHGIFQARILEWVAISSSRGSSCPRDQTCVPCICCSGRQIPYLGSPEEPGKEQRERLKATWICPCPSDFIYKSRFMLSHLLINNLLMFLNNNK